MHWVSLLFRTPLQINSLDGRMCSVCSRLDRRLCVCPFSPPPQVRRLWRLWFPPQFIDDLTSCLPPQILHANWKAVVTQLETGARPSGVTVTVTWEHAVAESPQWPALGTPLDWTSSFFLVCLWWNGSSIHCLILQCSGSGTLILKVLVCVIWVP